MQFKGFTRFGTLEQRDICCKHAMTWLNSNSACDESFQSGLCVEQGGPCILKMSALVPHGHMDLHSTWEFNPALARLNLAQICCR